jgi:hypothetical protein
LKTTSGGAHKKAQRAFCAACALFEVINIRIEQAQAVAVKLARLHLQLPVTHNAVGVH